MKKNLISITLLCTLLFNYHASYGADIKQQRAAAASQIILAPQQNLTFDNVKAKKNIAQLISEYIQDKELQDPRNDLFSKTITFKNKLAHAYEQNPSPLYKKKLDSVQTTLKKQLIDVLKQQTDALYDETSYQNAAKYLASSMKKIFSPEEIATYSDVNFPSFLTSLENGSENEPNDSDRKFKFYFNFFKRMPTMYAMPNQDDYEFLPITNEQSKAFLKKIKNDTPDEIVSTLSLLLEFKTETKQQLNEFNINEDPVAISQLCSKLITIEPLISEASKIFFKQKAKVVYPSIDAFEAQFNKDKKFITTALIPNINESTKRDLQKYIDAFMEAKPNVAQAIITSNETNPIVNEQPPVTVADNPPPVKLQQTASVAPEPVKQQPTKVTTMPVATSAPGSAPDKTPQQAQWSIVGVVESFFKTLLWLLMPWRWWK